jgi:MoxR-like ATPase
MTMSPIQTEPRHLTALGNVQEILQKAITESLNVLLIGTHGVGKTQLVCGEVRRQKLSFKYYSAATLDPWSDLVGIPIPVEASGTNGNPARHLEFIRPADLDAAEMVFFDELNRSHPKVQNAVLEMIQFRTINGSPLKRLRMVWAAINPPGDVYAVNELDPALLDRFQMFVQVNAAPSAEYYRDDAGIPDPIA